MIDLHVHSTESDGSLTPEQLVKQAVTAGLEALAIADHDTMAGYAPAAQVASASGIELVCAVEVSTRFERPGLGAKGVHLLGYFLNGSPGEEFLAWLRQQQQRRHHRNQRLAERLQQLGLEVSLEEVAALAGRLVGRVHFAQLMIRKGYVDSVAEAFQIYLGRGGAAYMPSEKPTVEEAIHKICEAGGLACIAHPGRLRFDLESALGGWKVQGLAGLEVFHSEHSGTQVAYLQELANRYELVVTGGSDFHGEGKPGVELGSGFRGNLRVERWVLEGLKEASERLIGARPGT